MLSASILLAASIVVGQAEQVKIAVPQEVLSFFGGFVGEWRMEGVAHGWSRVGCQYVEMGRRETLPYLRHCVERGRSNGPSTCYLWVGSGEEAAC